MVHKNGWLTVTPNQGSCLKKNSGLIQSFSVSSAVSLGNTGKFGNVLRNPPCVLCLECKSNPKGFLSQDACGREHLPVGGTCRETWSLDAGMGSGISSPCSGSKMKVHPCRVLSIYLLP